MMTARRARRKRERRAFTHYMQFVDERTGELIGDLADISPEGFRLESTKPIPVNAEVSFRVDLPPDISKKPWMVFTARSRRSLPHPVDKSLYEAGFEIMKMDPGDSQSFELLFDRYGSTSAGRDPGTDYLWTD